MCGIVDDVFNFAKDSIGEIFKHPGEALGAAFGVPGYDPFFGGLFNPDHSLLSPTGNFSSSAWNDMYNDNPNDSGALGLFHGINSVADKVAPAAAGYFAAPAMAGALGGTTGEAAGGLGAEGLSTGLESTGSLGGLESGLGGAGMFGVNAGTGTVLGSGIAQGMGAGGLGIAGGESLGGLTAAGGTFTGALGGGTSGTGLGSYTGGAQLPPTSAPVDVGNGASSLEGGQAAPGASQMGASGGGQPGANLSTMYGPDSTATQSPMGTALGQSTSGVGGAVQNGALGAGSSGTGAGMNVSDLQSLFNLAKSGYGAYQQWHQGQQAQDYMGSLKGLFSPDSPYAKQMAQTLGRTDAAAGRNSQYGTRAVQLAAALAQSQANVMGGNNYAQAANNANKGSMFNSLFSNFSDPKQLQGLYNMGSAGFNGLASLFS